MTIDWQDALLSFAKPQKRTLEQILTSPEGFGLAQATPVQRAVCRILDGEPLRELARNPEVCSALGCSGSAIQPVQPKELVLVAGIRGGKSLMAGACAVRAAITCDVSRLGPGEVPRVSIVSLSLDTARATWAHVRGNVEASPELRKLLAAEPTADSLVLRHPSGRIVEIRVVAGSRAAGTLVSRWSAGVIFDEAPRMVGSDDGVVNLDDARHAVLGRLLPGAQALYIGSPWAPFGPVYDMVQEHHGKPTRDMVVVRAKGPWMNPSWWTPERCAELQRSNPDAYRVDVETEFLAPESMLFSEEDVRRCMREKPGDVAPQPGHEYVATMDPATRGNAWTLVVATCTGSAAGLRRIRVALARQWIGSRTKPLSPDETMREIAELLQPYRVDTLVTDQWAIDALVDIAERYRLYLREETATGPGNVEAYTTMHTMAVSGCLELPNDPQLRTDMLGVKKRVTQTGVTIVLPKTSDGRHCDYAPAVARACSVHIEEPSPVDEKPVGTAEWHEHREAERMARWQERHNAESSGDSSWIWGPGR